MPLARSLPVVCMLTLTTPALAQTIKEAPTTADMEADAAIQHFRLGVEFYRLGNYDAARVEFEAAYGLSKMSDQSGKAPHLSVGVSVRPNPCLQNARIRRPRSAGSNAAAISFDIVSSRC